MPTAKTLVLIDGSGFIFRAFHALPMMTRTDGVPVNAVYGFCTMLNKLLVENDFLHIAVIFDAGRKTFRNDLYPAYKANRPPPPEELVPQFSLIREATKAYGLPSVELSGYEADDLIAAYAHAARQKGFDVRIVSSDKDLMQLIRDGVCMIDPIKGTPIGPDDVLKKFGVTPDKVVDVQALSGDSIDNIPGVPGIGVKTAAQLINEFGSLDALLENAATIKQPKRRDSLITHADEARLSLKLVSLDSSAPLPVPLEKLVKEPNNLDLRIAFLKEQGFKSLLAKLNQNSTNDPTTSNKDTAYELVQTTDRLDFWCEAARAQGLIAIDTETDSLTPSTAKLVGISLAVDPGKACYIPVGHIDPNATPDDEGGLFGSNAQTPKQINLETVVKKLKPILEDPAILKIAHNMKYDSQVLEQHGLNILSFDDTMLCSYALDAGLHGHGLDELAKLYFNHNKIPFSAVAGTGKNQVTFDRVPLDKATAYSAEDADYTMRLWRLLRPRVTQEHVARVMTRMDAPLVPVVAQMETYGIRVDPDILRQQSADFAVRLAKLEAEIHALAGHPFNIASSQQLSRVLFDELGLLPGAKSKSGTYSTAQSVLEPLADAGHEIVAKILDWRSLAKLKSTYTDALPQQISKETGRVHTSFSLVGAATGRLSSTDPNLQNIPIRTEDGRAIRRAFVAQKGCTLLSVDYSQIELRLAASVAGVEALIQAFHEGIDIHAHTASQVFGIPLKDMTPERRRAAKAINFGIIYGISGFGLAKQIGTTPAEASAFIKDYLARFHELNDWMEATKDFARAHGYVETLFGRRVHVAEINAKNAVQRNFAERQAVNAPLQGTAADIIKRAMVRVGDALRTKGLGARLLLQVHDELIFEVPKAELDATIPCVRSVMENAPAPVVTLRVPLVAEAGHADNWADAH
ncbi:MAG: DNA polymerase I [Alphaproteobacteria bacterium]|nr:DNA polymerase I [Alphaproteobacteria bacterium]